MDWDRSTIEYCMFHENDLKLAIYEKKHDRGNKGGGTKAAISKPTENEALWNLKSVGTVLVNNYMVVDEPERMLDVIRYTKARFNDGKYGRVYRARYIQHEDYIVTCEKFGISKSTYYNYVNIIVTFAERKILC